MKFSGWFSWLCLLPSASLAQVPAVLPTPPKVNDPALKIELLATIPEVEACTTVVGTPDGAVYVGSDPRDGRLNTKEPVCWITRFSSAGSDRRRTVFADKLYSPAGSAWHDGWLYVIHDPFMSRFKDTDGDGVADVREDLITNLGLVPYEGLNDHCVSGFTLGMDGLFYISVGDRGIYQAKSTKDGSTLTMQGGGIIRCRPDGSQLEIFSTGTRNHLQVNLDAEDNAFTRDNTDDGNGWWTRLTHHIEGGYYGYPYDYQSAPNFGVTLPSNQTKEVAGRKDRIDSSTVVDRRGGGRGLGVVGSWASSYNAERFLPAMTDFGGGSPTGGLCYLSDGLPEQYRGKHFFSEWGKAGIFVTEVARDAATFKFVKDTKLVEPGKGGEFRPMQISVANDGSLLIADWGYGGWKSPRVAGAVWRLFWPEAKPAPRLKDESKASIEELIAALGHADRDQRLRAEWALIEKGESIVERLSGVLNDDHTTAVQRSHIIWTLENMMGPALIDFPKKYSDEKARLIASVTGLIERVARTSDPVTEGQAMRALSYRRTRFDCEVVGELAARLHASNDSVPRLQAILAMGRMAYMNLPPLLLKSLQDPDRWIRFAARYSLRRQIENFGLSSFDLETKDFAKPELNEQEWLMLESVRLAEGQFAMPADPRPLPNVRAIWGQEDVIPFIAGRLAGTTNATPADRARAARALGRFAYKPKPFAGHWWGTQPVKSARPPNSLPCEGTSKALEALSAALGDSDAGVRRAAAAAFSNFILDSHDSSPPAAAGLAALRTRLVAETDSLVRRQLIESLGVQKDPQAMDTFVKITLDRTTSVDSRKAALEAITRIGGDLAHKTVAELVRTDLPNEIALDVIRAIGQLKVADAAELLKGRLHATDPALRLACIKSLAALGTKANATAALIEMLSDKDTNVQQAAVEALGTIRGKAALPALIALAENNKLKKEAIKAISNMADESAIPVLIGAIADKDTTIRRDALKALKNMREKSWPLVEERLATGLVPPEFETEIRTTFQSGAITKWKMLGPFENVWDAVHPPEADAAVAAVYDRRTPTSDAAPTVIDRRYSGLLAKTYPNAEGKAVGWREVSADSESGRVNLENVFKTTAMVCAYAYAPIDAPEEADAKILAGSNDQLAIWLNGNKIYNVAAQREFQADKDDIPVHLLAGKNHLFVKIGNVEGGWEFAVRMPGYENGKFVKAKEVGPEQKQRAFALAKKPDGSWRNPGSARRGEKIFHEKDGPLAAICATCHAVGALGGQTGPNLSLIGTIYNRADLITSILEPSKTIALGFDNALLETKAGETIAGVLRSESAEAVVIISADAQQHTVAKGEVKTLTRLPTSFMPPGLTVGLKPEQFADLVAYLETLGR